MEMNWAALLNAWSKGGTQEDSTPESEVLVASFSWRLRITSNSSEPELLWRHREEEEEEEVMKRRKWWWKEEVKLRGQEERRGGTEKHLMSYRDNL